MRLVEIRDLDGPNLFLLEPAIKIELDWGDSTSAPSGKALDALTGRCREWLHMLHEVADQPDPRVMTRALDTPGHIAIAYSWERRAFAMRLAEIIAGSVIGSQKALDAGRYRDDLAGLLANDDPDDHPLMVRDADRHVPVIGVTGTNGKTTTTRLIAHICMKNGRHAGWSSSSGVYIDGVEVLQGDYSGPSGARRVLHDDAIDVAVLETARGGILLRGIACESNDVSVYTNVSADHLDLQGIRTVESLAEVKSLVAAITKPEGLAVLNAGDPLVMSSSAEIVAPRLIFALDPANPHVETHVAAGGLAIVCKHNTLVLWRDGEPNAILPVDEIPLTFGGRASHMIENAMAAAGAAIGLGLSLDDIAEGLRTFRNSAEQNLGRLNVFDLDGVIVILDYAHNEVGLDLLITFGKTWLGKKGRLTSIIGTAGDRTNQSLTEIGRIAAAGSDRVIIKETVRFLRGRTNPEINGLHQAGIRSAGKPEAEIAPTEIDALQLALQSTKPGDVVVIMCQEQMVEIREFLEARGKALS